MGLQLQETVKGVICNYHRIIKMKVDCISGTTHVLIGVYKDKNIRDVDIGSYIDTESWIFNTADIDRNKVYSEIKKPYENDEGEMVDSKFKNAINILESGQMI